MSNDISGDRRRQLAWPRQAGVLAAMACITLLATACGGGSSPAASATGGSTHNQKALAYSQCVRSHGVPDFPDPNSNGDIVYNQGGSTRGKSSQGGSSPSGQSHVSESQLQAAERACQHLLTSGGPQMSGAQQQQALSRLVQYAGCMRAHGVPNFPDPTSANGQMGLSMTGVDVHSPQYQSAQRACQSLSGKGQSSAGGKS